MRKMCAWVLGFLLVVPSVASAKDDGFEAGARLGYGIPMGKATGDSNSDLKDSTSGQFPIWIDLGYRLNPNIFLGGYLSYGFASTGSSLDEICKQSGVDCSTSSLRVGGQLQYHFMPAESTDAWGGVGVGWERLAFSASAMGQEITVDISGFEFAMLQGGVDFRVHDVVALGPFLGLTFAQYGSEGCSGDPTFCGPDQNIQKKAFHEWLFLGVRGSFGPF